MKLNCYFLSIMFLGISVIAAETPKQINKTWPARLRGFNTEGPQADLATEKIFKNFKKWNVNLIRLNLKQDRQADLRAKTYGKLIPVPEYMKAYQLHLTRLDKVIALCKKYKIYMIISAAKIVGRNKKNVAEEGISKDVNSVKFEKNLLDFWKYIAAKYKDDPMVIGYDLLNEPHTKGEMKYWSTRIIPTLVQAIRAIDQQTTFIIEPAPWGLPKGYKNFQPIDDPKTVYSFHFYAPHNYTHQSIGKKKRDGSGIYPGKLKMFNSSPEIMWNRATLKKSMQPAIDFMRKHKVRMFVGEFSVIRWARGGAAQWMEDSISLFEENGFDWTYHSYTGWNGWNPTFTADAKQSSEPDGGADTERLKILKKYWSLNKK